MKFGVLTFSYNGSVLFPERMSERGYIDTNIGDNVQTIAVRRLYARLGIPLQDVLPVDRDSLPDYDGPPVMLMMNACFMRRSFPIPDSVTPVFVGFQAKEPVIVEFLDYFRRHQPIGCRDVRTARLFVRHGVKAFVTGCLTLTFDARTSPPQDPRVFIVYGSGVGGFPAEVLRLMPEHLLRNAEFVSQRKIFHRFPMTAQDICDAETHAAGLLDEYRQHASLVVTPLHHAAAPCIAMGIPVVICRTNANPRFSFLKTLLPVHVAPDFGRIDWMPEPVNVTKLRNELVALVGATLTRLGK